MKNLILSIALISLCACTTDVVQMGKSSYMATTTSCGICQSPVTKAIITANQYCAAKGQVATVTHTQITGIGPYSGTVQFMCTDDIDQKSVVLRPDRGIDQKDITIHVGN